MSRGGSAISISMRTFPCPISACASVLTEMFTSVAISCKTVFSSCPDPARWAASTGRGTSSARPPHLALWACTSAFSRRWKAASLSLHICRTPMTFGTPPPATNPTRYEGRMLSTASMDVMWRWQWTSVSQAARRSRLRTECSSLLGGANVLPAAASLPPPARLGCTSLPHKPGAEVHSKYRNSASTKRGKRSNGTSGARAAWLSTPIAAWERNPTPSVACGTIGSLASEPSGKPGECSLAVASMASSHGTGSGLCPGKSRYSSRRLSMRWVLSGSAALSSAPKPLPYICLRENRALSAYVCKNRGARAVDLAMASRPEGMPAEHRRPGKLWAS